MTLARIPKVLFVLAAAVTVYLLLSAVVWIGMAHAQTAPAPIPAPAPGTPIADIMMVVLLGAIAVLSGLRTILQFFAPRTRTTIDDRVLAGIEELLALVPRQPVPLPVQSQRDPERGSASLVAMGVVVAVGLAAATLWSGCAGAGPVLRAKATVATDTFLACEEANVSALAAEMTPYIIATIRGLVSGDGVPSADALKHAASKVTSMAGQCAWEAAIAVLMQTAMPSVAGASARVVDDRGGMAANWLRARAELQWAPTR